MSKAASRRRDKEVLISNNMVWCGDFLFKSLRAEGGVEMKLIIATIKSQQLAGIEKALHEVGIDKVALSNVLDCGQLAYSEAYRAFKREDNSFEKIRLEIAVNEEFVENVIKAIVKGAKINNVVDVKIFIVPLDRCVRIWTETEQESRAAIS